ncbi:type II toxin-antitoxin system mRNA interferase toxin, RelE/StbE family [Patescibacteria group bacterium]|nr:type II toxin-antitoxin system mRNA interferase toxin, RelE/StbE family [Patescibacteria group bacterium]MBU1256461.1 type II toxin-antitoxin system mRNA interferase toxin, RelE/StbE family [Patescibacteria group bacterium]MBU1457263.1 type II toxin-antitoxin system mRNA interferase toxin, RelE/StbE family [Patescibacteria group bacterium]
MIILTHPNFSKNFKKRIKLNSRLVKRFQNRIHLFAENSKHPTLKDHQLSRTKKRLRSFSITGDIRIVYQQISKNKILLLDIGSHNQVY